MKPCLTCTAVLPDDPEYDFCTSCLTRIPLAIWELLEAAKRIQVPGWRFTPNLIKAMMREQFYHAPKVEPKLEIDADALLAELGL